MGIFFKFCSFSVLILLKWHSTSNCISFSHIILLFDHGSIWFSALDFMGQTACLKSYSNLAFCASFAWCFLNFFSRMSQNILNVLIQSLVLSAQTRCKSGKSVVHLSLYHSAKIPYENGTAQKYISPSTEILLYSATASFFPPYFHRLLNLPLKRRRKQETGTENSYDSEEYVSNVREWWFREITGLIHSGSSWLSSVFLQKCTNNW